MVDTRPINSGTLAWYVDWLGERNPEWTEDQRLEVATGFAKAQQPPTRPTLEEIVEDNRIEDEDNTERATARSEKRLREFIGGLYREAGE